MSDAWLKVDAGVLLYRQMRAIAFEYDLKLEEVKTGWLSRSFKFTGPVANITQAKVYLESLQHKLEANTYE